MIGKTWPEAIAAGAHGGTHVVAIDGALLPPNATRFTVGQRVRAAGRVLTLTVVGDDGHAAIVRLTRQRAFANRTWPDVGLRVATLGILDPINDAFASGILFVLSLLLFRRRPRDPEAILLAYGFLMMGTNLGYSDWLFWPHGLVPPAFGIWLFHVIGVTGFWCMLVGITAFPDGRFVTRWARVVRWIPTTYVIVNSATGFALWQWSLADYAIDVPIFALIIASLLLRYRMLPPGMARQQIKWTLFGGAVMVLAAVICALVEVPLVAARLGPGAVYVAAALLGTIKTLAFPLGLLVSLLRYRLYDADTVIARSAGYAALSVSLVAVFACTEQLAQSIGQDLFGNRLGVFASGLGAAVAAVLIAPLHRRIGDWTERRFQAELLDLRIDLPRVLGDLRETIAPAELAEIVLERILASVHARHGGLVLHDKLLAVRGIATPEAMTFLESLSDCGLTEKLHADPASDLFPLRIALASERTGRLGWILIGPRPDGSFYRKDERDALVAIADPLTSALAISEMRQARDAALRTEMAALHTQISSILRLVEELSRRPIAT